MKTRFPHMLNFVEIIVLLCSHIMAPSRSFCLKMVFIGGDKNLSSSCSAIPSSILKSKNLKWHRIPMVDFGMWYHLVWLWESKVSFKREGTKESDTFVLLTWNTVLSHQQICYRKIGFHHQKILIFSPKHCVIKCSIQQFILEFIASCFLLFSINITVHIFFWSTEECGEKKI